MFYCLKCNAPLQIDKSLERANAGQLDLLVNNKNIVSVPTTQLDPAKFIPSDRLQLLQEVDKAGFNEPVHFLDTIEEQTTDSLPDQDSSPDASLLVNGTDVEEPVAVQAPQESIESNGPNPISGRIHTLEKIFDILSSRGEASHPMCEECAELLIENYKLKFDQNQREKELYMTFLKKLRLKDDSDINESDLDAKLKESITECKDLRSQEQEKLEELRTLEEKKEELLSELQQAKDKLANQQKNELQNALFLKNELHWTLSRKTDKLEQEKARYRVVLNQLDHLRSLNMYTRFFDIAADEKFGKINGFRLGHKVPWLEVNCALGQVVLLAVFLCKRLEIKLHGYKLVPMGSRSQIVKPTPDGAHDKTKTVLNLYLSNELSLGKLFNFNKLDVSMIALLDVLSQIEAKVMSLDSEIELPYKISPKKDTIGGKSIRVTSNSEWTHSCKFLLVNFKWILTYASSRDVQ